MNGFYELLQVPPDASPEVLRAAYHEQVAQIVRRLRTAEAKQQDVAPIEARRTALADAWAVLSDPTRRRRYDRFRELARTGLPATLDELWAKAGASLVDPAAAAAVEGVRLLTDLRVGEPMIAAPPPPEPEVSPVSVRPDSGRAARPEAPRAEPPRVAPRPPPTERGVTRPVVAEAPGPAPVPATSEVGAAPRKPGDARSAPAPAASLDLDRSVGAERLSRLLDQYGPTGAYLRAVRELRRIPLEQLSATTRVAIRFLDALERDAYNDLPSATYVRGYVRMVVLALEAVPPGPEADEMIDGYMSRFHRARG
jgi:hypothetical protein